MRVALIGCGKLKASAPSPARDLYTSDLFRLQLRYAVAVAERVFILSAKHGLLEPAQVVAPYEHRLQRGERAGWGRRVAERLAALCPGPLSIVGLAGQEYLEAIPLLVGWELVAPLAGMGVGERRRWLKEQAEAAEESTAEKQELAVRLAEVAKLSIADAARRLADAVRDFDDMYGETEDPETEMCVPGSVWSLWAALAVRAGVRPDVKAAGGGFLPAQGKAACSDLPLFEARRG